MDNLEKRQIILTRARELYIATGITRNITKALKMYLEHYAGPDEQIPLFITSTEIHQIIKILEHIRPRCDECDAELHLQVNARDPAGKAYPTAWTCKKCAIVYYSDKTPAEWLKELQDEARKQGLHKPDKPFMAAMPPGRQSSEI